MKIVLDFENKIVTLVSNVNLATNKTIFKTNSKMIKCKEHAMRLEI